jgi:plasmid maintenance system antidote protein VapI
MQRQIRVLALQTQRDLWTAGQTAKDRKRIKPIAALEVA